MEHEFYTGLSILAMMVFAVKKTGSSFAAYLDKEVEVLFAKLDVLKMESQM